MGIRGFLLGRGNSTGKSSKVGTGLSGLKNSVAGVEYVRGHYIVLKAILKILVLISSEMRNY